MELQFWSILMLVLCMTYTALGDTLDTKERIVSYKDHRVTLPCRFTTTDKDDWMFIRWRRSQNGTDVNLASIQNRVFSAEWSPTAPEEFIDRAELRKKLGDGEYSLDLVIDGFLCSDIAVYKCDVFTMSSSANIQSQTVLEMKAKPGQPSIVTSSIEAKENDTFSIECNADVGIPPRDILWWYTVPEAPLIYQKVTDGITQEVAPNDNCTNIAKSTLALTMSAALDGAVFTCSPTLETGDDGKPKNADNVTIMIYGKTTTTQSTAAPSTTKPSVTTEISSATVVTLPFSAVILACLVTIFNLYFTRTT